MATETLQAGINVEMDDVLAEAVYVKNVTLEYGGFAPYTAVYGRLPRGLFPMDSDTLDAIEDGGTGDDRPGAQPTGNLSHTIRLREIALRAFLEAITLD